MEGLELAEMLGAVEAGAGSLVGCGWPGAGLRRGQAWYVDW